MEQERFRQLLRRYANGDCTPRERRLLEDQVLRNPVVGDWEWSSAEEKVLMGLRIRQAIDKRRLGSAKLAMKIKWYWGMAATLLIGVSIWWFGFYRPTNGVQEPLHISETSAFPTEGIRLTLADGSVVSLDSMESGLLDAATGLEIRKDGEGRLVYAYRGKEALGADEGVPPFNTIHIPNGKQFQLTLPDGTDVWMNTATTLTYPIAFTGNERKVELEGEAYFEVAKDTAKPFKVIANGTEVVVTGTHFNVSAYSSDEAVTTTLLEGGVTVRREGQEVALSPGYQAIARQSAPVERQKANVEQSLAWKNGYFIFDDMDIASVMRSVARWYDVEVTVEANVNKKHFGGTFPIADGIDELLADLTIVGKIQVERTGNKVRVVR